MPVVEESVTIARPTHAIFEYVVQAANLPVWDSSTIAAAQLDEGPPRLGTCTRGSSKLLGRRIEWVTQITEFEHDETVTWSTIKGPFSFAATVSLAPAAAGTRLTYRVEGESGLGGVFGRLADPLVASALGRTVRANLANLADLLTVA